MIYERLADDQPYRDDTFQHLADFASLGTVIVCRSSVITAYVDVSLTGICR